MQCLLKQCLPFEKVQQIFISILSSRVKLLMYIKATICTRWDIIDIVNSNCRRSHVPCQRDFLQTAVRSDWGIFPSCCSS